MTACRWEESFDGLHYLLGVEVRAVPHELKKRMYVEGADIGAALEWPRDCQCDAATLERDDGGVQREAQ